MFDNNRVFENVRENVTNFFNPNRRGGREANNNRRRGAQTHRNQRPQRQQAPPPPPPAPPGRAPPASKKAINELTRIRVGPDDLIDPSNRECAICMEDNKLDEWVTRLPCGHIFHTPCIVDWLSNHSCSCPVCRYELPTDDPGYEAGRKQRMKSRKPRFAMHELKRMRVSHLYRLARGPVKGIVEKKDLIDSLIDNRWIDVVPDPDPVRYDLEVLKAMKIGELKRTMEEAGVFFRRGDVLMKSDMLSLFENSGRLIPIKSDPPVEELVAPENYDATTGDVATGKDQQCSSENTTGDSEFETLSATDCNGDDFVIVETADDGSIIMDADDPADEEFDDRQSGSPIVMFPEQFDDLMSRELDP